ncbi:unnamed protein product [Owenia fusiformis]|uniref:Uncharacterized protein n=1 Tax=Owenia fusiformis TaxID=6347 RepID=A0A8J1TH05_OWEFU|nr:unnamed protein product [Owenia fusiformis]
MFRSASPYLYKATRRRAYFKRIGILVPPTWSDDPQYLDANLETFDNADFRVDTGNPNNNPYTRQLGPCGEPADYCHLTPDYILDTHKDTYQRFGPPGRVLVHEFSHLRYGVFDEYGEENSTKAPPFYIGANGKPAATGCTDKINGIFIHKTTKGRCRRMPYTGLPEADCRFIPDPNQTTKASVMHMQFLDSVVTFCETSSTDPDLQHNILAPNMQNRKCNKRGTWDVILEHNDFAGNNNPPRDIFDLTPDIQVVKRRNSGACKRMVLVLDRSGSMGGNRLFVLAQAAYKFIISTAPDGVELGIVVFDTNAAIGHHMQQIRDIHDRESLVAGLPTSTGGSTEIGEGVLLALDMLKYNSVSTAGAKILVMSDGGENPGGNTIDVVLASGVFYNTGITADIIAFSNSAAQSLERLASRTGGRAFFYSEDPRSTALDDSFVSSLGDTTNCQGTQPVEIRSEKMHVRTSRPTQQSIFVDHSLRRDTTFMFTPPPSIRNTGTIVIQVTSPSARIYTVRHPEYTEHQHFVVIRIFIPGVSESGYWQYTIQNLMVDGYVGVNIRSTPTTRSSGITMRSWVNKLQVNVPTDTAIVYAELAQGYSPVIRAHVEATIELPGRHFKDILLYDNGIGSDNFKDDGVYSNFFTDVNGDDRYAVTVKASNPNGTAVLLHHSRSSGSPAYDQLHENENEWHESIGNFQREASGGSFKVRNSGRKGEYDLGRVEDLSVERISIGNRTVTLTWTAPGRNAFSGKVARFEIFIHHKIEALVANHLNGYVLHPSDLVNGTLDPLPAFSKHRIVIQFPKTDDEMSYSFVMRSWNEHNKPGELSNYVTATLMDLYDAPETTTQGSTATTGNTVQRPQASPSGDNTLGFFLGIPLAVVALILIIILCIYALVVRKKKKIDDEKPFTRAVDAENAAWEMVSHRPLFVNHAYNSTPGHSRRLSESEMRSQNGISTVYDRVM